MGLNKRFINQENLKRMIQNGSTLFEIINYIKKPDVLVIEDEFSRKISNAVLNNEIGLLEELIYGEKKR